MTKTLEIQLISVVWGNGMTIFELSMKINKMMLTIDLDSAMTKSTIFW